MIKSGRRALSFRNPYSTSQSIIKTDATTSGSSVRDWRQRMARHLDASTSYTRSGRDVLLESRGDWKAVYETRPNSAYPFTRYQTYAQGFLALDQGLPSLPAIPSSVENAARAAFISEVNAARRAFESTTALGEIHKTLDQVLHPLRSFRSGITRYLHTVNKRGAAAVTRRRSVRRVGSPARARIISEMLTGTYLEWKFGVMPTILDISAAAEALSRQSGNVFDSRDVHGKGKHHGQTVDSTSYHASEWVLAGPGLYGPTQEGGVSATRVLVYQVKVRYSGNVALRIQPSLSREFGFTARDFLPSIWNLLPWSWAIDYVANVGDVISAVCTSYGDIHWCNKAVSREVTERWTSTAPYWNSSDSFNWKRVSLTAGSPSIVLVKYWDYTRTPVSPELANFVPVFPFRAPNLTQILNLGSAIVQARMVGNNLNKLIRGG